MLKKFAAVSFGVGAGLMAIAPAASASHDTDFGDQEGTANIQCSAEGGDSVETGGEGVIGVGDIASGNTGQLLSCNSILNDIANDNEISIAGGLLGD